MEEGLTKLWLVLVCSRKAVSQLFRGSKFMIKCSLKVTSRLAASAGASAAMIINGVYSMVLTISLVP